MGIMTEAELCLCASVCEREREREGQTERTEAKRQNLGQTQEQP